MGDPRATPKQIKEILSLVMDGLRESAKDGRSIMLSFSRDAAALTLKLLSLKVYVYEHKVPKDGHGPVVIIAEDRELADKQYREQFHIKWPQVSVKELDRQLKNCRVLEKPVAPGIFLDQHGI